MEPLLLPWAGEGPPTPNDPWLNASANMALLGAAKAIVRRPGYTGPADASAEDVVAAALRDMSLPERLEAARMLRRTQQRVYAALSALRASGKDHITAEDVSQAMADTL
jgi:hypothetical protein